MDMFIEGNEVPYPNSSVLGYDTKGEDSFC